MARRGELDSLPLVQSDFEGDELHTTTSDIVRRLYADPRAAIAGDGSGQSLERKDASP